MTPQEEILISPIEVRVVLQDGQYVGRNRWRCTINGEEREVARPEVLWYCEDIEGAVHSFKKKELKSFTITGNFPSL